MSTLEQISTVQRNGKTLTKFVVSYEEQKSKVEHKPEQKKEQKSKVEHKPEKKNEPLRIKITTPKDRTYVYVKSKIPYAIISKGKVVKTSEHNKNKFYPHHIYLFKKNQQGENFVYLETTTNEGKKYLKRLFKTEFEQLTLECEQNSHVIELGSRFSYKKGQFKIEQLGRQSR